MNAAKLIAAIALATLFFASDNKQATAAESNKVRVGYIGLTCEASIFSAVENGFFKEEGLDVTLIKSDWKTYKDTLALGGYDITQHLVMYFLKPIEQGLDVKFLGGIHTGCLRIQAGAKSNIQSVADLRGKRIGVPGMGTPPFVFAIVSSNATVLTRARKSNGRFFRWASWVWRLTRERLTPSPLLNQSEACSSLAAKSETQPIKPPTGPSKMSTAARSSRTESG